MYLTADCSAGKPISATPSQKCGSIRGAGKRRTSPSRRLHWELVREVAEAWGLGDADPAELERAFALVAPIAGAPGPGVVAADAERNAPRWLLIAAAETRAFGHPVWVATPIEPGQGR